MRCTYRLALMLTLALLSVESTFAIGSSSTVGNGIEAGLTSRPRIGDAKSDPFALVAVKLVPTAPIIKRPERKVPVIVAKPAAPLQVMAPLPAPLPVMQYLGQAVDAVGEKKVLLSFQQSAIWVQRGSTFDGQFELVNIDSKNLVFKNLSSGEMHFLKIPPLPAFESR